MDHGFVSCNQRLRMLQAPWQRSLCRETWKKVSSFFGCQSRYPLVNLQKTIENHHFFNGKIHYKWGIFYSYVSLPEGKFVATKVMKLWIPSKWTLEDQIHHLSSITIVVLLLKSIMQHICATVKTPYIVCGHQSHTGNPCNGSMDKKPSGNLA